MKFDSEGLWRHASNVAYALNKAYECLKAKKQNDKILQSFHLASYKKEWKQPMEEM